MGKLVFCNLLLFLCPVLRELVLTYGENFSWRPSTSTRQQYTGHVATVRDDVIVHLSHTMNKDVSLIV